MTALAGVHILIVEDDALVAGMLADMLTELGAVVVGPAPSVAEGMSLATGRGQVTFAASPGEPDCPTMAA